jgi:serine/threonine protein kinase
LITDFGSVFHAKVTSEIATEDVITKVYACLELLNKKDADPSDPSYDIWALGIISYELMALELPYWQILDEERVKAILNNDRKPLPTSYSDELIEIVDKLLTLEQSDRPNIIQVLQFPLIKAEIDKIMSDFIPLTEGTSIKKKDDPYTSE